VRHDRSRLAQLLEGSVFIPERRMDNGQPVRLSCTSDQRSTSMSTAMTSGVVALMIEASRSTNGAGVALPPNAIKPFWSILL
jgi:hypothetical protein